MNQTEFARAYFIGEQYCFPSFTWDQLFDMKHLHDEKRKKCAEVTLLVSAKLVSSQNGASLFSRTSVDVKWSDMILSVLDKCPPKGSNKYRQSNQKHYVIILSRLCPGASQYCDCTLHCNLYLASLNHWLEEYRWNVFALLLSSE